MAQGTLFKTSNAIMFTEAGHIQLIKTLPDYSDSKNPSDIYTSGRNAVGIITPSYTLNTVPIESENSAAPIATRVTSATQEFVVNFNSYDELLFTFATNSRVEYVDNAPIEFVNQARQVTSDGTKFTVDMGAPMSEIQTVLVRDEYANMALRQIKTGTPTEEEFTIDYATGKITVNEAHEGKAFFVSGAYISPRQKQIRTPDKPSLSNYKLIIWGKASDVVNATDEKWTATIIDQVQFTGTISQPPRQKSPGTWSVTLSMQAPRAGRDAMVTKTINPLAVSQFKSLTVRSIAGTSTGDTKITISEPLSVGATYAYKTDAFVDMPDFADDLSSWTSWDGVADITATSGNQIVIAEVGPTKLCLGAGLATVTAKV